MRLFGCFWHFYVTMPVFMKMTGEKWNFENSLFSTQMLVQRLEMVMILKNIIENLSLAQKMPNIFRNVHPRSHFS